MVGLVDGTNGSIYKTYYASGYNISNGTYLSGSVPSSVTSVDADYFIVRSVGTDTSVNTYNPSGYNLLGSTTLDSGSVSNLATDDGSYMAFRSYASNFSSGDNNAFIAYQAGAAAEVRIPKYRTWNGSAWSNQSSMPTAASPLRWVRSVYSSLEARYYEKIVVTLSDDQYLDAYVWTGSSWSGSSNIGQVGAVSVDTRSYNLKYEKTSGRALLVWSTGGGTVDMRYKIWSGATWSNTYNLDISGTASGTEIYWIAMAQNPTTDSNELTLIAIDGSNGDVYGLIWNGTAWGNEQQLETNVAITTEESIAVAYEQTSGDAIFVWSSAPDNTYSRQWNGTAWEASSTLVDLTGPAAPNWISLKSDPASDSLMLVVVDSMQDLNTADWNGTAWTIHTEHDIFVNTDFARCADVDWEPSGSKALLVWGTDTTNLSWKTWTPAGGWTSQSDFNYAGADAQWIQLRRDPRGVGTAKIFVSVSDVNMDGFVVKWNGIALSDSVTFTTQIVATTYENFDLAFQNFGEPNEYTVEVEFTGTSNTYTWTQLNWTIDSAWDTASASVTLQLYNYSSGSYPTSGDGYISYTSSATANTDENKNQTITTNPEDFRDFSGKWKVKVKGVKSTSIQFEFKADWIEFKTTYYNEYTVSTEFTFSNMTTKTPTQLNFTVVSQYNIASVSVAIQVWNYSSSAYATSGQAYLSYMSSGTNETKTLNIAANPQFYTSNGNAKIKITGVLATTTQYQQEINQVKLLYGYAAIPPVAFFTYTPTNPFVDETVTFNATGSYDPDGNITSYFWDFGDNSTGTDNITTHSYADDGIYTVTLNVTDDDGLSDTFSVNVTVLNTPPVANFTESAETAYAYVIITFNATDSYDPDGTISSYFWNFGDGTNATGVTTSHWYSAAGNYTVTLTVTDDDGATASANATKTILSNEPPVALFTDSAETVYTDEFITFNATGSYDPDGNITSYFWDFGDGTNATEVIVSHAYADDGLYMVTLTATDDKDTTNSASATKTVLNRPPVASFTYTPINPVVNETVTFNASDSYDPDGTIVSYFWTFSDGTNRTGRTTTHTYTNPGTYNVTLTVTDNDSYINSTKRIITVHIHDIAIVDLTASATEVISGQIVNFTVLVKNNGTAAETFNVTLFYNENIIGRKTVTNLAPGDQTTLAFMWNTTGIAEASYRIQAEASVVSGEVETNNNAYTGIIVEISTQASLWPFDAVTTLLFILPVPFGLLFLVVLRLRRKKKAKPHIERKADMFSGQFGMTHQQMIGKKMLLEIDPASDYHESLLSFVAEAKNTNEPLFVFTSRNSTLHSALSEVGNVNLRLLTSRTSYPQQINEKEILLPASNLSVLLDAFDRIQKGEETPINMLFDNLSDIIVRCGFERTYKFMRLLLEIISSPKVTALFVFNPTSHDQATSSSIRSLFKIQLAYAKAGPKVGTL